MILGKCQERVEKIKKIKVWTLYIFLFSMTGWGRDNTPPSYIPSRF